MLKILAIAIGSLFFMYGLFQVLVMAIDISSGYGASVFHLITTLVLLIMPGSLLLYFGLMHRKASNVEKQATLNPLMQLIYDFKNGFHKGIQENESVEVKNNKDKQL